MLIRANEKYHSHSYHIFSKLLPHFYKALYNLPPLTHTSDMFNWFDSSDREKTKANVRRVIDSFEVLEAIEDAFETPVGARFQFNNHTDTLVGIHQRLLETQDPFFMQLSNELNTRLTVRCTEWPEWFLLRFACIQANVRGMLTRRRVHFAMLSSDDNAMSMCM